MNNPLLPGPHRLTEQIIRVPYRIEQHEEEQKQDSADLPREHPKPHDPYWNRRFWSIQHVHDCIEGKTFHWFWSPMGEVFNLSQVMFLLLPFAAWANKNGASLNVRSLIMIALSMKVLLVALRYLLEWFHDWRFERTPYRIVRHP